MKILADKYIARAASAFSSLGEVVLFEPPLPNAADLRDCDVLLVRSVTRVDENLLHDSRVHFVGTATSGVDHVDSNFLTARGIGFAAAPGCNARPVAEYVVSALCVLLEQRGLSFPEISVGVIGHGHVGSTLRGFLDALGVKCLINDPPLEAAGHDDDDFLPLDDVLQADVITVHVPLTQTGNWPTRHLLDAGRLRQLRAGTILINSARGGVIDESALKSILPERDLAVALDVWENEPAIDATLAKQVMLATPHIAGYSLEAKLRATLAMHRAVAAYLGVEPDWQPVPARYNVQYLPISVTDFADGARLAILASYDVRGDAAPLREIDNLAAAARANYFCSLRDGYTLRREFPATVLQLDTAIAAHAELYRQLGFQVEIAR